MHNISFIISTRIGSFLCLFACSVVDAFSQTSISLGYYDSEVTSRNIGIMASTQKKKHTYSYGIKYHFNDPLVPGEIAYRNLYAYNFAQRFGIMLGYERDLFRNKKIALKASYTFKGTISGTRDLYYGIDFSTGQNTEAIFIKNPVYLVDNILGLSLNAQANDKIGFFVKFGGGLHTSWYPAKDYGTKILGVEGDLSADIIRYAYSAGIFYTLTDKSKKNKRKR